MTWMDTY